MAEDMCTRARGMKILIWGTLGVFLSHESVYTSDQAEPFSEFLPLFLFLGLARPVLQLSALDEFPSTTISCIRRPMRKPPNKFLINFFSVLYSMCL
jgi:hypothetical protein